MKTEITIKKFFILLITCIWACTAYTQTPVVVTNQNLNIAGSLAVGVWQSNNSNKPYPDYPKMYYAFALGDEIAIDFTTNNGKGTQRITVTEYESGSIAYSNNAFQTLTDIRIKIPKTGIYKFEFATNHLLDRQCNVIIKRIPSANAPANFNYNVSWKTTNDTIFTITEEVVKVKTKYTPVTLQAPIEHYINSGRNAMFQGGKSRIIVPVMLPANTVEWYYTFSATRKNEDVEATKNNMKLFANLGRLIDQTGTLSFAANAVTEPPGANYCDIFLIESQYHNTFLNKEDNNWRHYPEGTRENLKSGVVKVKSCCTNGTYYLGIRNPDSGYGVNVIIEVVAITQEDVYEKRIVKRPASITQNKIPYITN